jgi:hypothetical protein
VSAPIGREFTCVVCKTVYWIPARDVEKDDGFCSQECREKSYDDDDDYRYPLSRAD